MENDPKKILLIDDSALMRRAMSDIINHIDGFTVAYLAADGEKGYAYLSKQNDIDVVVTGDIGLVDVVIPLGKLWHLHAQHPRPCERRMQQSAAEDRPAVGGRDIVVDIDRPALDLRVMVFFLDRMTYFFHWYHSISVAK